jgi:O-antigen/teichoic acid export membrane protein
MNLQQQAIRGVIWSALESWGKQAISFIVFFLLARLLGPETFGLVALASVFLAFVQLLNDQGLAQAIIQRKEIEPEHLDTAFWTNLGVGSLLTTVSISAAGLVATFFNEPGLAPIIRWLSLTFVIGSLSSVQQAIFSRKLDFKAHATRSLIAMLIGGVVGVTMALMNYGVWSLVGQQLANSIAQCLVVWWITDWRPGLRVSQKHFKDLFSFGVNVFGFNLVNFFNRRSDDFLIGYFLGSTALGYYAVAYRLLLVVIELIARVIDRVAIALFSKIQQEPERLRRGYYTVTQLTSLLAFPCFLGMAALAPELVPVLFGEQWTPSIPVMQILSFIGILQSIGIFNSTVILSQGKPFWRLVFGSINSLVAVTGFLISVRWGIVAVATSYVISGYLLSPIPILLIRKLINIKISKYLGQFVVPLLATLMMVGVIFAIKYFLADLLTMQVLLAICIVSGAATYVLAVYLIAPSVSRQIVEFAQVSLLKPKK